MMEPTWQTDDGRVKLWNCDCYTLLDAWPSDAALVTDPPYGIALSTNYAATRRAAEARDTRRHAWPGREHSDAMHGDDRPFDPAPFLRFKTLCLWGAQNYANSLPSRYSWLVWDKRDNRGAKCHLGDAELAWCSGVPFNSVRMFHHLWIGYQRDSEVGEGSQHPTQKPVALMAWCLDMCGVTDGPVIDPFMGVGGLGVACGRRGLRYFGVEIDPTYFEIAKARIQRELAQPYIPALAPERQVDVELPIRESCSRELRQEHLRADVRNGERDFNGTPVRDGGI